MTEDEVREMLRKACDEHGSQNKFAKKAGISAQYVGDFLKARRGPGAALLRVLGVVKVVSYERKAG